MRFKNWQYPKIEEGKLTKHNWLVQHKDKLKLGYKTEDYVQIGSHCAIYSISTIDNKEGTVTLKKNCKIGSHSVIMPGVTVGENSIVGAFSFVNTDIPVNVVAAGVPAKVIKKIKSNPRSRR
jgi:acetyltransferase-like isoleucine patch superfamily enzyme